MSTDSTSQLIKAMFSGLQRKGAVSAMPVLGTLSEELKDVVNRARGEITTINAATLSHFATASVEMWHRSVHSFLISASLAEASPLWASVSGYYSSHYSIRAFAHLFGYFKLHKKKEIFQVEVNGGQYICHNLKENKNEHKFYWNRVKDNSSFLNDPLFTKNEPGQKCSDCGHRNIANYFDHINKFPNFKVLDKEYLKQRVGRISTIQLSDVPIPNTKKYPDTLNVQLIAYHRLVRFRKYVDEVLGISNSFWNLHRNPHWCLAYLDFQVIDPEYQSIFREQLK